MQAAGPKVRYGQIRIFQKNRDKLSHALLSAGLAHGQNNDYGTKGFFIELVLRAKDWRGRPYPAEWYEDPFVREVRDHLAEWDPTPGLGGGRNRERVKQAVERVLAKYRAGGKIDVAALKARFGTMAEELLFTLENDGIRNRLTMREERGLKRDRRAVYLRADDPAHALSALAFRYASTRPFKDTVVVGVQHMFADEVLLVEAMQAAGLDPKEMLLVGKPYSAQMDDALRDMGVSTYVPSYGEWGRNFSGYMGMTSTDYGAALLAAITPRVEAVLRNPKKKLLLIDDGGALIHLVNEKWPQLKGRVAAVEQTTRGKHELAGVELQMPVMKAFDSEAKTVYESPMIGRTVGKALMSRLENFTARSELEPDGKLLFVGFGNVARATARYMRKAHPDRPLEMYDSNPTPAMLAEAEKLGVKILATLDEGVEQASIVLCASGDRSLDRKRIAKLRNNAIVASAGSLTHEVDDSVWQHSPEDWRDNLPPFLRRPADQRFDPWPTDQEEIRDLVAKLPNGNRVHLLASGYPINLVRKRGKPFYDGSNRNGPMPTRYSQLTPSLLFISAVEVLDKMDQPGFHSMSAEGQSNAVNAVTNQLRQTGESLLDPRN